MDEIFIYKLFDDIIYDDLSQGYDKNVEKAYYEIEYEILWQAKDCFCDGERCSN